MSMKYFINTFVNGIDVDTSINKYDNTHVLDALNMRVVTDDPLSTGALTSIKGNLRKASISGEGFAILGYTLIRDIAILFVYTPTGGRIYKFKDSGTAGESLEDELILVYESEDLGFASDMKIYAVGRYETTDIQKVYFTDGNTFFRHLNIASDTYPISLPINALDVISDLKQSNIDWEFVAGGNLKSGKVQYSYQLYNVTGSETMFSTPTNLIPIAETIDFNKSSFFVHGYNQGVNSNKSIKLTIPITTDDYTRIRVVALDYESPTLLPAVRIVGDYDIENEDILTIVDTGASKGTMTIEEYRFIVNDFIPKTLEVKDNILFAGNIKENYFDILPEDFDARAYRFKYNIVDYTCKILNNIGDPLDESTFTFVDQESIPTIDLESDCFNYFNDLDNDGNVNYEYKYNPITGTLGGAGKHISYEFITKPVVIDEGYLKYREYYNTNRVTTEIQDSSELAKIYTDYVGYQRDEIYRFAIVFYDKKGRQSFVHWIGDIRFPDNTAMPYISYNDEDEITTANILGIKFNVTIPDNIKDIISGWQIVRMDRTDSDKTIKAQGLLSKLAAATDRYRSGQGGIRLNDRVYSSTTTPFVIDVAQNAIQHKRFSDPEVPYANSDSILDNGPLSPKHVEFTSPDICFNKRLPSLAGDFVEGIGALTFPFYNHMIDVLKDNQYNLDKWRGFVPWSKTDIYDNNQMVKKQIDFSKVFTQTLDSSSLFTLEDSTPYYNQCGNLRASNGKYGSRGTFALLGFSDEFSVPTSSYFTGGASYARVMLANYRTNKKFAIYGGVAYESRLSNTYIKASDFKLPEETSAEVYNGDTYIEMFTYFRTLVDLFYSTSGDICQSIVMFPVESTINVKLRSDKIQQYTTWVYNANGLYNSSEPWSQAPRYALNELQTTGVLQFDLNYPSDFGDMYQYNYTYSVPDKSKTFISKPLDIPNTRVFDTRVYASQPKISGELIDSWLKFRYNDYIDIDSEYGYLTRLLNVNNRLVYFQPDGVGILSVNDRSVISDNNAGKLVLGTGGILTRFDYVIYDSGASTQEAIIKSNKTFYYADNKRKRINMMNEGDSPISATKGINSKLKALPFNNIKSGYDPNYNEVYFTIDGWTVSYNEFTQAFLNTQSFDPDQYMTIGNDFYTFKNWGDFNPLLANDNPQNIDYDDLGNPILVNDSEDGGTIYKHGVGPDGTYYNVSGDQAEDCYVELIIHPEGNGVCTFSNLDLRMEVFDTDYNEVFTDSTTELKPIFNTIKRIEFSNSYISTSTAIVYGKTIKKIGKVWRVQVPIVPDRKYPNKSIRFIDTYLKVKIIFDNATINRLRLHDIITYYYPSRV